MSLLEILKTHNIKPKELADKLNINTGQIYRWNKEGIKITNPHATKLKKLFPELTFIQTKTKKDGAEDKRSYNKKSKSPLILKETVAPPEEEKKYIYKDHPVLPGLKDEYGLPYINIEERGPDWYRKRKNLKKINPLIKKGINWDRIPNQK